MVLLRKRVTAMLAGSGSVQGVLAGLAVVLLLGPLSAAQYARQPEFVDMIIGRVRVEFSQRMIGEAIVEGDYILRQYDLESGELIKEVVQWRPGLPERLPPVITSEQAVAAAEVEGEVGAAQLYYIADQFDVHPVYSPNPCWVIDIPAYGARGWETVVSVIVDAVTGEVLGGAVPPPQYYTGFSVTGPQCHQGTPSCPTTGVTATQCLFSWDPWYQNAASWFAKMGYGVEAVKWPTELKVQSHIASNSTAVFYELAHGGSHSFSSGCAGGSVYEVTTAAEIKKWIANYPPMPFSFIGSCGGMCDTVAGSLSYELRKGSSVDTATVGYCGMSGAYCSTYCWHAGYTVAWQDAFFKYASQGKPVYQAYLYALADYPACAPAQAGWCMLFAGDPELKLVPPLSRRALPEVRPRLPDLRVLPKTIWDVVGPRLHIRLWLRNEGLLPVRERLDIDFVLDGERVRRQPGPMLPPGEEIMMWVELEVPAGWHVMEIIIDPMNEVEEADEGNNVFAFEFACGRP
ncbi:MAG: CARDB domain-containing protein [Candidatus Bipolaricaulaceae bacterium]